MIFSRPGVELKTPEQLKLMRRAGLVVARALSATVSEVRPGITTGELDAIAAEVIASAGATPSFLDYGAGADGSGGFPGVVCLSVNEEIVHGIPGQRVLAEGDLISIDCGAIVDGWHGDSARTVAVGETSAEYARLSEVTRGALWHGIAAARLGGRVSDISAAIEDFIDEQPEQYGIVAEYVGHGIGSAMHQPPDVPNYRHHGRSQRIVPGLALAVEPMLTLGSPDNDTLADEWTVVIRDRSVAAHWEHTITVTKDGLWVLTAEDGGESMLAELGVPFGPIV
ncbi:type I methionyl aminopeptidase [Enemella evansiae]|uniref:Methionine aminopeptidase n=1 Tax=Enemella evansiae TaxID=2016499 RepID=A0A255GFR3_9ACTN|nr:type I methionyl aminopeptidase [Enemella evansiae]OYO13366.1 type I methionyl aminopeptidase [Enemella evansiae]